jgi:hypothetical protein
VPTRIDLQRYKKTYPFLRREPRILYTSTSEPTLAATIEAATASFGGSDQITYNFTKEFSSAPKVTLTAAGTIANFNVFIVSVSQTQLVLKASVPNTDTVHIHAIEVTA